MSSEVMAPLHRWPPSLGQIAVILLSTYLGTSLLLLRFPVLHKKKRQAFQSVHISHRGGAGENLENTMTAFRHAVKNTATDMLEIDCHLSKDGQVVVAHDGILLRTTGSSHRICDTDFCDFPELKTSLALDFSKDFVLRSSGDDRKIPLLRELFEEFPNVPINIDIKENSDELIQKISDLIKKYRREHLTVWGNFRGIVCEKCYQENPRIPLLFSIPRVLKIVILFYTGLLPFVPIKEQFLEIPMPSIFLKKKTNVVLAKQFTPWTIWIIDQLMMRKSLFMHLRRRGIQVYLWVLNDEEDFKRAYRLGANGVMTDFPTRLRKFLDENPECVIRAL